jgi:hypothetical protein
VGNEGLSTPDNKIFTRMWGKRKGICLRWELACVIVKVGEGRTGENGGGFMLGYGRWVREARGNSLFVGTRDARREGTLMSCALGRKGGRCQPKAGDDEGMLLESVGITGGNCMQLGVGSIRCSRMVS